MTSILTNTQLKLTVKRLAHQLLEDVTDVKDVVFIGLQPRGVLVAEAIVEEMEKIADGNTIQFGILDITFYRDDVRKEIHLAKKTAIPFSTDGKQVILIDDVLYTGRTIRAALDALQDFGRPASVKLAVLVNRLFNRELPIQPDFCGLAINTQSSQSVKVDWNKGEVLLY